MSTRAWNASGADRPPACDVSCDLDVTSTHEVRRLVRGLLPARSGIVADDAALVADELISNAHRHGSGPRACRLSLLDDGRCLRIEVDDTASAQPRLRTPDQFGGRGMILVDRLASSWGVWNHPDHKTVWADLALDGAGSSGHARHLAVAPPDSGEDQ
jgi:hypothetical protein